jgi:hypothetical protein
LLVLSPGQSVKKLFWGQTEARVRRKLSKAKSAEGGHSE